MERLFGGMYDDVSHPVAPAASLGEALDEDVQWSVNPLLGPDHGATVKAAADRNEWGPNALRQRLEEEGSPGVCNALSAAYLAGHIRPSEGRLGISEATYGPIKKLKGTLDERQETEREPSSVITMKYAAEQLARKATKAGAPVAEGALDQERARELSESNKDITPASLAGHVTDAWTEKETGNVQGTVDIGAGTSARDDEREVGHQLAYKHLREAGKLEIFDQTTGLRTVRPGAEGDASDGAMSAALGKHMHDVYIDNPFTLPATEEQPDAKPSDYSQVNTRVMQMLG